MIVEKIALSRNLYILFLSLCLWMTAVCAVAQSSGTRKAAPMKASIYSTVPSGYQRVGTTRLYYKKNANIDIIGEFNSKYYSSTFNDNGYKVAMKVGSNSAVDVDCLNGTTNNGVRFSAAIEQQAELARIKYVVTNTNSYNVTVSLGVHADVMIGSNDKAPISRRIDTVGQTYGLTMKDGKGAQLCVLFGAGLAGVTAANDFWFGSFTTNSSAAAMVGDYSSGTNYMKENGSYDSGMGWCWKNRIIMAVTSSTTSAMASPPSGSMVVSREAQLKFFRWKFGDFRLFSYLCSR